MLGLSFGKLLLLAVIIAVVWYGLKYLSRAEAVRRAQRQGDQRQADPRQGNQRRRGMGTTGAPLRAVEDLIKCARCGAYVAARGASACGRPDCPWGR